MHNSWKSIILKLRVWGFKGVWSYLGVRYDSFCARKALKRNAAKYKEVVPAHGITVVAPLTMKYSHSNAVRDFVFALKKAEIPFQTFDTNRCPEVSLADYADVLTPEQEFRVNKYDHVIEMFKSPLPEGIVKHRARIAFWEGESGMLDVFPYLAGPDPVIGMSDFNVAYFRKALPPTTPVYKILYPLQTDVSGFDVPAAVRARFGIGAEDFSVFFNFDLGSYYRKNPEGALRAFALAFKGTPGTKLVFKLKLATEHADKIAILEKLALELGVRDKLVLVKDYLSKKDLHGLTNACDVYLSLHRAEGFGIGIAEAMSLGKAVVVTDYSSSTEFCRPDNSIPVPYKLVPVPPQEYFGPMGEWADADTEAAATALRKFHEDPAFREAIGQKAKAFIADYFSTENFRKSVEAFLMNRCTSTEEG